jgi:hypothetical protein
MKLQSDLVANVHKLRQKIALMTLVEIVFRRPVDNRVISFAESATGTKQPPTEVHERSTFNVMPIV